jgi:putative protein kinase ArgK-like GTPase of G3E family
MQELAKHPEVFIRPTASGEHLGGVAAATRETILLLGSGLIMIQFWLKLLGLDKVKQLFMA